MVEKGNTNKENQERRTIITYLKKIYEEEYGVIHLRCINSLADLIMDYTEDEINEINPTILFADADYEDELEQKVELLNEAIKVSLLKGAFLENQDYFDVGHLCYEKLEALFKEHKILKQNNKDLFKYKLSVKEKLYDEWASILNKYYDLIYGMDSSDEDNHMIKSEEGPIILT